MPTVNPNPNPGFAAPPTPQQKANLAAATAAAAAKVAPKAPAPAPAPDNMAGFFAPAQFPKTPTPQTYYPATGQTVMGAPPSSTPPVGTGAPNPNAYTMNVAGEQQYKNAVDRYNAANPGKTITYTPRSTYDLGAQVQKVGNVYKVGDREFMTEQAANDWAKTQGQASSQAVQNLQQKASTGDKTAQAQLTQLGVQNIGKGTPNPTQPGGVDWGSMTPPQVPKPTGDPIADAAAMQAYQSQLNAWKAAIETRRKAQADAAGSAFTTNQNIQKAGAQAPVVPQQTQPPQRSSFAPGPQGDAEYSKALNSFVNQTAAGAISGQPGAGKYASPEEALQNGDYASYALMTGQSQGPQGPQIDFDKISHGDYDEFLKSNVSAYQSIIADLTQVSAAQIGEAKAQTDAMIAQLTKREQLYETEKQATIAQIDANSTHLVDVATAARDVQLKKNELEAQRTEAAYDQRIGVQEDNNSRLMGFMQGKFAAAGMLDSGAGLQLIGKYMEGANMALNQLVTDKEIAKETYLNNAQGIMTDYFEQVYKVENQRITSENEINFKMMDQINEIEQNKITSIANKNNFVLSTIKDLADKKLSVQQATTSMVMSIAQQKMEQLKFQHQITQDAADNAYRDKSFSLEQDKFAWQKDQGMWDRNFSREQFDWQKSTIGNWQKTESYDEYGNKTVSYFNDKTGEIRSQDQMERSLYSGNADTTGAYSTEPWKVTGPGVYDSSPAPRGTYNVNSDRLQFGADGSFRVNVPPNVKGGQCGHFVDQLTGVGVPDLYSEKMKLTDPNIKVPNPGDIFVMPIQGSKYGHIGFIEQRTDANGKPDPNGKYAMVGDSNWHNNEKVDHHVIALSSITGYIRPNVLSQQQQPQQSLMSASEYMHSNAGYSATPPEKPVGFMSAFVKAQSENKNPAPQIEDAFLFGSNQGTNQNYQAPPETPSYQKSTPSSQDELSKFSSEASSWGDNILNGNASLAQIEDPGLRTAVSKYMAVKESSNQNVSPEFTNVLNDAIASSGMNKQQAANLKSAFNSYMNSGDTESAKALLSSALRQKMPATESKEYDDLTYTAAEAAQFANEVKTNATQYKGGVYDRFLNDTRKWGNAAQDPKYANLIEKSQLIQAAFRKTLLGSSMTNTEIGNSKFFIMPDDKPADVIRKLQNMAEYIGGQNAVTEKKYGLDKIQSLGSSSSSGSTADDYLKKYGF